MNYALRNAYYYIILRASKGQDAPQSIFRLPRTATVIQLPDRLSPQRRNAKRPRTIPTLGLSSFGSGLASYCVQYSGSRKWTLLYFCDLLPWLLMLSRPSSK